MFLIFLLFYPIIMHLLNISMMYLIWAFIPMTLYILYLGTGGNKKA